MSVKKMFTDLIGDVQHKLIGKSVAAVLDKYPDASKDLVQHYVASRLITKTVGPVTSLGVGLFKEALDGIGAKFDVGTKGRSAGFSVDDLGADWVGATGMSVDDAYKKGMFSHTETAQNMVGGQGVPKEVFKKIIKKVN